MAYKTRSRAGGVNVRGGLSRSGLGNVSSYMEQRGKTPDYFKGIDYNLSRSMRSSGGSRSRGRRESESSRARRESRTRQREAKNAAILQDKMAAKRTGREESLRMAMERRMRELADYRAAQMARAEYFGPGRANQLQMLPNMVEAAQAVGPAAAHQGLMQTGQLLANQGAGGVVSGPEGEAQNPYGFAGNPNPNPLPMSPEAMNAYARERWGGSLTPQEVAQMETGTGFQGAPGTVMQMPGPGSGRETGGGIPETGWYQLHEGEQVVPAPDKLQEMVVDMMIDRQMGAPVGSRTKAKKGKGKKNASKKSYQQGTEGAAEALMQMLGIYQPREQPFGPELTTPGGVPYSEIGVRPGEGPFPTQEGPQSGEEILTREALSTLPDVPGMPSPITQGPQPDRDVQKGELDQELAMRDRMRSRAAVADPNTHPQEALDSVAKERQRIEGADASQGTDVSNPWTGTGTKDDPYKIEGAPYGMADRLQDEYDRESREIEKLNDEARSHARYASELLAYASQRPNSMAYEKLRSMASDRLKLAQETERVATVRQKQLDAKSAAMAEQQANVASAEIEARGRVGAAQAGAQGRIGAAQAGGKDEMMRRMSELYRAYAGTDADPEQQEAQFNQLMQLFMMMSGFQEALGGGLPNG